VNQSESILTLLTAYGSFLFSLWRGFCDKLCKLPPSLVLPSSVLLTGPRDLIISTVVDGRRHVTTGVTADKNDSPPISEIASSLPPLPSNLTNDMYGGSASSGGRFSLSAKTYLAPTHREQARDNNDRFVREAERRKLEVCSFCSSP